MRSTCFTRLPSVEIVQLVMAGQFLEKRQLVVMRQCGAETGCGGDADAGQCGGAGAPPGL